MVKLALTLAVAAAALMPVAAFATDTTPTPSTVASQICKAEQVSMGLRDVREDLRHEHLGCQRLRQVRGEAQQHGAGRRHQCREDLQGRADCRSGRVHEEVRHEQGLFVR